MDTSQLKNDLAFALSTLLDVCDPGRVRAQLEDMGNTEAELDEAVKRLGEFCGMDIGFL